MIVIVILLLYICVCLILHNLFEASARADDEMYEDTIARWEEYTNDGYIEVQD